MTVKDFAEKNSLTVFSMPDGDAVITGGYTGDLLSWVMGRAKCGDAWITIMSNINIAAVASLAGTACIILAEGVVPDENLAAAAEQKDINVLGSDKTSFELSALLAGQL